MSYTSIKLTGTLVLVFMMIGYIFNGVKFVNCDFEAPYKCEIIHGIGLIPVFGPFLGWWDFGK
jgi:hypothetical protein